MTGFQIALYAACRVAVPGKYELRSVTTVDGGLAVVATPRDGSGPGRYVMVSNNLGWEAPRLDRESSWDKAIRRAVEALQRELRDERI